MSRRARGDSAERFAKSWLEEQGLTCVTTNYHCRFGEIDLVMQDKATLVFVEVRLRGSADYGGAVASVDARKQRKLIRTAEHYLATKGCSARQACRIDVVAIQSVDSEWQVEWLQNAVVQ